MVELQCVLIISQWWHKYVLTADGWCTSKETTSPDGIWHLSACVWWRHTPCIPAISQQADQQYAYAHFIWPQCQTGGCAEMRQGCSYRHSWNGNLPHTQTLHPRPTASQTISPVTSHDTSYSKLLVTAKTEPIGGERGAASWGRSTNDFET